MDLFGEEDVVEPRGWAEFWFLYPRKVARAAALKAFTKLKPNAKTMDQIVRALCIQKGIWQKHRGRDWLTFVPHASTWLNGRRWEDEVPGSRPQSARPKYDKKKYTETEAELAKSQRLLKEWQMRRRGQDNGAAGVTEGSGQTAKGAGNAGRQRTDGNEDSADVEAEGSPGSQRSESQDDGESRVHSVDDSSD